MENEFRDEPVELISLSALARRLDLSFPTVAQRILDHRVKADAMTCRGHVLFRTARLDELAAILKHPAPLSEPEVIA